MPYHTIPYHTWRAFSPLTSPNATLCHQSISFRQSMSVTGNFSSAIRTNTTYVSVCVRVCVCNSKHLRAVLVPALVPVEGGRHYSRKTAARETPDETEQQ
jgi:hypothetical protein